MEILKIIEIKDENNEKQCKECPCCLYELDDELTVCPECWTAISKN